MKVLRAAWYWINDDPIALITVDAIPARDNMLFEERDGLFFAKNNGYVDFYAYSQPGRGFGGSKFTIKMIDGSVKELIGPWSSRCEVMNEAGFTPSLEVLLCTPDCPGGRLGYLTQEWYDSNVAELLGRQMRTR